MQKAL